MNILWLTWKDAGHPAAGGAEAVAASLTRRLARDGHAVTILAGGWPGAEPETGQNGCRVIRLGGRATVYWHAYRYYGRHLRNWADLLVEEINSVPFFTRAYRGGTPAVRLIHQLAGEVWFHQLPRTVGAVGYLIEPLLLRWLARDRSLFLTGSQSTRSDLRRHGVRNAAVFPYPLELAPLPDLSAATPKPPIPTILSFGSIRPMKRPDHVLRIFERAKRRIPDLRLIVAGGGTGPYHDRVLREIESSPHRRDIEVMGRVADADKARVLAGAHLIVAASVKEGWGLTVTEAASQGTPAVAYDVDGLRDSVRHGETGWVVPPNPEAAAEAVVSLLEDRGTVDRLRRNAFEWSRTFTPEASYAAFREAVRSCGIRL